MSLNQLFDQFIGGAQAQDGSQQKTSGGLAALTDNIPGGLVGGLAAGGLLGVLVGNKKVRKTAGKMATGAVGLGGAAILGAVAFNAYKNWQGGKEPPTTPSSPVSPPNSPASPPQQAVSVSSVPKISARRFPA